MSALRSYASQQKIYLLTSAMPGLSLASHHKASPIYLICLVFKLLVIYVSVATKLLVGARQTCIHTGKQHIEESQVL